MSTPMADTVRIYNFIKTCESCGRNVTEKCRRIGKHRFYDLYTCTLSCNEGGKPYSPPDPSILFHYDGINERTGKPYYEGTIKKIFRIVNDRIPDRI